MAKHLEEMLDIPIRLDKRSIADVGIDVNTPVTFALSNVSARAAIKLMLRPLGLTAIIKFESLIITTTEEAEITLQTRVYDVFDVLSRDRKYNHFDFESNGEND